MLGCMIWGDCCLGFWVFRVDFRVIYGFWGWIYECEGVARCFKGFWGIYWGFIWGFKGQLCHFNDFIYILLVINAMTVILLIIFVLINCSFLNHLSIYLCIKWEGF